MSRPDWTYGFFYRLKSRLLHRFNLHHTRRFVVEDGAEFERCDWCGLHRTVWPPGFKMPVQDSSSGSAEVDDTPVVGLGSGSGEGRAEA